MNKKLLYGLAIPLFVIVLVAAAWYVTSIKVTASVGEPLSTEAIPLDFSGVAGSCYTQQININNAANGVVPVQLNWVETSNDGVTYSMTNIPGTEYLGSGENLIDIELCYNPLSSLGDISGNILISRGSGDITGIAKFTQKDISTWIPEGETAEIEYTVLGSQFIAIGIPEGYTLIYYPNTEGDVFATNIANIIVLDEGANNISSLPIVLDVGDDYCNNGFNPNATVCNGAKLWLIPGTETEAMAKLSSWTEPETYLFETDLITYTKA